MDNLDTTGELDESIDSVLVEMSKETMRLLDSLTDEVAELSSENSPKSVVTPTSSVRGNNEKEEIKSISQIESDEDCRSDDDDDDSSNASFLEELSALREVSKQIEKELHNETTDSMNEAMKCILNSPDPNSKIRITLESDDCDRKIIDRILDEEKIMESNVPKSETEQLVSSRIRQQGITATETTYVLSVLCVMVWSIVFGLMQKVMYTEI